MSALILGVIILFPLSAFAGSATYATPGTYTFTIPWYSTINAYVYGAGGGGGYSQPGEGGWETNPASAGTASYFRTLTTDSSFDLIGYGGGAGQGAWGYMQCEYYSGDGDCIGQHWVYFGGAAGAHGSWTGYGASGSIGGGAAGGTGGSQWATAGSIGAPPIAGNGGNGGYVARSWSKGQSYAPVYNSTITIIVGSGGSGGAYYGYPANGSNGAGGSVTISWSDGPAPTCSITVAANPINAGQSTTLSWSSTDITGGWFYITNVGYVSGSGSATIGPSVTTTYNGTVSGPGGSGNCSQTLTVNPAASVDVSASPTSIAYNDSSTISWTGSNVNNCTMSGGTWGSGTSVSTSGSNSSGALTTSTTYTFSCKYVYDQSLTYTDTQTVTVAAAPAPSCSTFSANPTSITQGQYSTITWSCSNATSCTGTNFSTGGATSGNTSVNPSQTTNYSLSCTGAGGTTNYTNGATVSVTCAPVYSCSGNTITYTNAACETTNVTTCSSPYYCSAGSSACTYPSVAAGLPGGADGILAVPKLVRNGATANIRWDVDNAAACTVSGNGNTWTGTADSRTSNPITEYTTYSISCDDLDGDTTQDDFTDSANIYVLPTWFEF